MSAFEFVTAWANAPFAIAAGLAGAFALLQVTGLLSVLAGDSDGAHDVDHDLDADGGGGDSGDGSHAADARGFGGAALSTFGIGKLPFSLLWQTFALAFAAGGYALNLRYLGHDGGPPPHSLLWSVPLSLGCGYLVVAVTAKVLGPVLSSKEHEATSRAHLVGQTGVVISSRVDSEFGEIRIRDKTGHDVRVICKLPPGRTAPVLENERVVVVDYDEERGELQVEALGDILRAGADRES